jgi:maleamate amidohydrolase
MTPVWEPFLTDRDKRVYADAGLGTMSGFGRQPALVIVDITYAFTGNERRPLEEAVQEYPTSCGERAWDSIEYNQRLLVAARGAGIPIFFTRPGYRADGADLGGWSRKFAGARHESMVDGAKGTMIVQELEPLPGEIVITKKKPSAFFATLLASYLIDRNVDTVIITGCTTSGCVRASVLDAFSHNFIVIVPEECTFDRGEAAHAINLFDMQQKYADVMPTNAVIEELEGFAPTSAILEPADSSVPLADLRHGS